MLDRYVTDTRPTVYRCIIDTLPLPSERLSTDMSTDMLTDTPYKTQDPIILPEQNFCLQFSLQLLPQTIPSKNIYVQQRRPRRSVCQ